MSRRASLRAWSRRHGFSLMSSLGTLWRHPLGSLLTMAVIGIALALPLLLYLAVQGVSGFQPLRGDLGAITVFLKSEVDDVAAQRLAANLSNRPDVASVAVISPDEALAEFRDASGFGEALDGLPDNPLPWVIILQPESAHNDNDLAGSGVSGNIDPGVLAQEITALEGVDFAQYDRRWLDRLAAILDLGRAMVRILAGLLGLGVVLVIGNTVRLDIQQRREEIEVLALTGATESFIRRPFLYGGLWYGLGGGLVALLLVAVAAIPLGGPMSQLLASYQQQPLDWNFQALPALLTLAAGGLLGLFGAMLAVRQHLRHFRLI